MQQQPLHRQRLQHIQQVLIMDQHWIFDIYYPRHYFSRFLAHSVTPSSAGASPKSVESIIGPSVYVGEAPVATGCRFLVLILLGPI
jgi:hypothetical protein